MIPGAQNVTRPTAIPRSPSRSSTHQSVCTFFAANAAKMAKMPVASAHAPKKITSVASVSPGLVNARTPKRIASTPRTR